MTFYPKNRKLLLIVGFFMCLVVLILLITPATNPDAEPTLLQKFVTIAIPMLVAAFCLYSAYSVRIVISSAGFDYYQVGFHARAALDSIDHVGSAQNTDRIQGLHLNSPAEIVSSWMPISQQRELLFIPLSGFNYDEDSELRKALRGFIS